VSATSEGPAEQNLYDGRYFDRELHRHHWFTNNAAKRERRWREVLRMLAPRAGDRILEIGCAAGEHALRLAGAAREVVGIDSAPAAIERAQARALREHVANASFRVADAADLRDFADASFDKVAAIDFVEHVDDATLARVLREAARVLARGGLLAIYTPCATHYVERLKARNLILRQIPGHIAVRAAPAYRALLAEAGLAVVALWHSPSDYPLFGAADRLLAPLPGIGAWFRFRICLVARKP
jgi:cyclopropane fatty-acyl-phospholipid synthase-like methyltransferase